MTPRYYLDGTIILLLLLQLLMTTITTSHDYSHTFSLKLTDEPYLIFFPKFLGIVSPFLEIISSAYFVFLYHFT